MTWWSWVERWRRRPLVQPVGPACATTAPAPNTASLPPDQPGGRLVAGRFSVTRLLGRGATGEVHLATDNRSGAQVALKLMAQRPGAEASTADQLAGSREMGAARRLQHPDIAAVLDSGHEAGTDWLAIEFAPGTSLARYTQPTRLLPAALVLRIGARIASALGHAHAQGVVHRDLKPSNVLVDLPSMGVKLLDFGVAHLENGTQTRTGLTLGTPAYMAPEQLVGLPVSPASDAYALGVVLFEMLTAQRPHGGASLGELLRQVAEAPAADLASLRPDLPGPAAAAVQQLLARDPQQRTADLAAWAVRAEQLASSLGAGSVT